MGMSGRGSGDGQSVHGHTEEGRDERKRREADGLAKQQTRNTLNNNEE